MSNITAAAVKALREATGAGMLDCQKALKETNGNHEQAVDWLRKKGIASAAKKQDRVAAEGLVGVEIAGTKAAIVEVNCETDFVAKNPEFQALMLKVAKTALEVGGNEAEITSKHETELLEATGKIGEKISFRRAKFLEVGSGAIAYYIHNAVKENPVLGQVGVLVALESKADGAKLREIGRQIAMHIASSKPAYLNITSVEPVALERERAVLEEKAKATGKPAAVIEKIVAGGVTKFYSECVLLEQPFVMSPDLKVSDFLAQTGKELGADVKLTAFAHFKVGEGIEKKETNLAEEVASITGAL